MAEPRTPTTVLMSCLEDFGEDEPVCAVVIYRTKSGDLAWSSSTVVHSEFVGMLEMAKFWFLEKRRTEGQ
jgi:hypothetical protein